MTDNREEQQNDLLKQYNRVKYSKLGASLLIDGIGMASMAVPVLGDASDLIWGPISGLACFLLYRSKKGAVVGAASAVKEIAPLTDIIPVVSGLWGYQYVINEEKTMQEFAQKTKMKERILQDN